MILVQFLPFGKTTEGFWALNGQVWAELALLNFAVLSSAFELTVGEDVKDHRFYLLHRTDMESGAQRH